MVARGDGQAKPGGGDGGFPAWLWPALVVLAVGGLLVWAALSTADPAPLQYPHG